MERLSRSRTEPERERRVEMAAVMPSTEDLRHMLSPTDADVATTTSPTRTAPDAAALPPSTTSATSAPAGGRSSADWPPALLSPIAVAAPTGSGAAASVAAALKATLGDDGRRTRPIGRVRDTSYSYFTGSSQRERHRSARSRRSRRRTMPSTRVWIADSTPARVFFSHICDPSDADVATMRSPARTPSCAALDPSYTRATSTPRPGFSRSCRPSGFLHATSKISTPSEPWSELLAVGPGPSRVAAAAGRSTSGILRKAEKEAR